jgi:hypothetical protein
MGPDIDTYFFLKKTDSGFVNLGDRTFDELAIRVLVGRATSDYRPAVGRKVSAIRHGTAQPYQPYTKWGDGLVVMPDGQLIWLKQREVDAFFQYHGLSSKEAGPSGILQGSGPVPGVLEVRPRSKTSSYSLSQITLDNGRKHPSCF